MNMITDILFKSKKNSIMTKKDPIKLFEEKKVRTI